MSALRSSVSLESVLFTWLTPGIPGPSSSGESTGKVGSHTNEVNVIVRTVLRTVFVKGVF
jgi:hypothetical protein